MQRTIYLLSIALLLPFAAVVAQQQHQDQITVENLSISKKADRLSITFDLNLDGLHLDKNNLLVVTPQILSAEGEKSVNLEPLAIKGSLRSKILDRPFTWKGKPDLPLAPERQVVQIIISGVTLPTNIANICCNPNGIACVKLGLPSN